MSSCMRCGERLQHNYLVTVFRVTKEKRERLVVCSKCKEILSKKPPEEQPEKQTEKQPGAVSESEPKTVPK